MRLPLKTRQSPNRSISLLQRALWRLVVSAALLAAFSARALGHDLSLSGVKIEMLPDRVVVTVVTPLSRLMRAEGLPGAVMTPVECDLAIRRRLRLTLNGVPFTPHSAEETSDGNADMISWRASLPVSAARCDLLARIYPEDNRARTLVTLLRNGRLVSEKMLDAANPRFTTTVEPSRGLLVFCRFLKEGVMHIFTGADHILFVVALVLIAVTLRDVLKTVTAFTLAHSITLSLAATGLYSPSSRWVEPLIALSITLAAVENLRLLRQNRHVALAEAIEPKRDLRVLCAFGFGLIHGCGFAGGLLDIGLPRAALGVSLAGFNMGVELGQCAIVMLVFPLLLRVGKHRPAWRLRLVTACSLVIGAAGAYWFFARLSV